jgi:hypothetical protein
MTKWHKGPPPSIGWWPASVVRDANILRWWNGWCWSAAAEEKSSQWGVIVAASKRENLSLQTEIEWTDRPEWWPARSKT